MKPTLKENHYINFTEFHSHICQNLMMWNANSFQKEHLLTQFSQEADNIEELMSRTLTHGESNSALIIAPRGGGKSSVISAVLGNLRDKNILQLGMVIKLNGLIQVNDSLALQEITQQLNIDEDSICKFKSFAENLSCVLKTLQSGDKKSSRPIIFVLDEFDLFCHHRNQTLLYNLFDISQSAQAPICVIGLTCRLDVIELLEKRVKSRFSHRQIFLFPIEKFENYLVVAESLLQVEDSNFKKKDLNAWNSSVKELFKNTEVCSIMKRTFCISQDIRYLKKFLLLVVSQITNEEPWLVLHHFKDVSAILADDSKVNALQDLSILQLSLMVAMKHLNAIYDGEPFNFEMVYRQYNKFGEKHSAMSSFERPVVFKAFDQLECLELIRPVEQVRSCTQREYRLMNLMVLPKHIEESLNTLPNVPTFLTRWCSSNVV